MKTKLKLFKAIVFFTVAFCVSAEIQFEKAELNPQDKILFSVKRNVSGSPAYSTVFLGDAKDFSSTKILTCYPEKMEMLSKGAVLQIRNSWGTARWSVADSNLSWISKKEEIPVTGELQIPQSVSPDGKWLCYIKKNNFAAGELILKNASTMQETVLNSQASFDSEKVPVQWSPDSSSLLYEKDGTVYFCEPKALFQKVQLSEDFRKIGRGSISNVCWANSKTIVYIDRDLIYRVNAGELYTRGLYSSVIEPGIVCGRLPSVFDEKHDSFTANAGANQLVLIQSDKIVNVFKLSDSGFEHVAPVISKTLTPSAGTVVSVKTFWTSQTRCLLWVKMLDYDGKNEKSAFYSVSDGIKLLGEVQTTLEPQLSPDSKRICFANSEALCVYDVNPWREIDRLEGEKIVSFVWADSETLYAGGNSTVKRWKIVSNTQNVQNAPTPAERTKTLFLSAGSNVFWQSDTAVLCEDPEKKGIFYEYDGYSGGWTRSLYKSEYSQAEQKTDRLQNGKFRVFMGTAENLNFTNALYVRTLSGKAVTRPYFPQTSQKCAAPKKVLLAIDAADDAKGLSQILYVLKKYRIPATFFVSGEFIRRYPKETQLIVKSGYECGSMFFTPLDLTSKGFIADEEFIRRGLARNEDEFFKTTGSELSLLWHAPFYKSTPEIKKSGEKCGYRYVEAGRFYLDTITLEQAARGKPGYLSAAELVTFYLQNVADGSVIPVSTGIATGSRSDYLYEKFDILVRELLTQGCQIVTFKEL